MIGASDIVRMTDADVERVVPVLARAFAGDPLFVWIEPDPARRAVFLQGFMRALAWRSHLFSLAFTSAPLALGASLWKGPELDELSVEQKRRCGLDRAMDPLDANGRRRLSAMDEVEDLLALTVPLPRWYLGVLAVTPEAQGQGLGQRLVEGVLARADAEGLPVSLETMREANLDYYARFGFARAAEGRLAGDGPRFWILRRAPASSPGRP